VTVSATNPPDPSPCEAFYQLQHDEVWIFNSTWIGTHLIQSPVQYECVENPVTTVFTLVLDFCRNVNLTYPSGIGWFYGVLTHFEYIKPEVIADRPVLTFQQTYSIGDDGAPCRDGRSMTVDIWCGNASTTCLQIPGSNDCLWGNADTICLCNSKCNNDTLNQGICSGITVTLLSHNCPSSTPYVGPAPPGPAMPNHNVAGVVIGSLVAIFFFFLFIGFMYNYLVHHKTGCSAVPFYDTCTGDSSTSSRSYESLPNTLAVRKK